MHANTFLILFQSWKIFINVFLTELMDAVKCNLSCTKPGRRGARQIWYSNIVKKEPFPTHSLNLFIASLYVFLHYDQLTKTSISLLLLNPCHIESGFGT